jgi:hypothetical protein
VHEGGYTVETLPNGRARFRHPSGTVLPDAPRSPPASCERLLERNHRTSPAIDATTGWNGEGDRMDLALAVDAVLQATSLA